MSRINTLNKALENAKLDSYIFTNRNNMFYFSGYTGEGTLFVKDSKTHIITDFRYLVQAEKESPDSIIHEIGVLNTGQLLHEIIKKNEKVGFEEDDITVQTLNAFKKECDNAEFVGSSRFGKILRIVKDEDEIELIKKAGHVTQDGLEKAYKTAAFGMKEYELAAEIEFYLKKKYGAEKAFDYIVASGENGAMPHAVPGDRKLQDGDMVTFDFGAKIAGYNSDMTRTFAMGRPSNRLTDIYKIVKEAQSEAEAALKPGVMCRDIDKIARDIIIKHGYGDFFGHGTGHGVGLNIHELPVVNSKSDDVLEKGMVITVEPGIYIPGLGGVRIENTCYITDNGYKSLYDASIDLKIIDGGRL